MVFGAGMGRCVEHTDNKEMSMRRKALEMALAAFALAALAASLGGVAGASADVMVDAGSLTHACIAHGGLLRIEAHCAKGEQAVGLNIVPLANASSVHVPDAGVASKKKAKSLRGPRGRRGPAGPQGPAGAQGPQGPAGTGSTVSYTAGTGLHLSGSAFSLDPTLLGNLTTACPAGAALTKLNAAGAPECLSPLTNVYAGSGLTAEYGPNSAKLGVSVPLILHNNENNPTVIAHNETGNASEFTGLYIGLLGRSDQYPLVLTNEKGENLMYVDSAGNIYYHGTLTKF